MRFIAFKGCTAYEAQIGRVWIKLLQPRFWCRRNLSHLVRVGIDRTTE